MHCPLCSSSKLKKQASVLYGSLYLCEKCDYLFKDPEVRLQQESEQLRYLEHNNDLQDSRYIQYLKKTWEKLETPPSQGRVLDFGCGPTQGLREVLKQHPQLAVDSYDPFFYPKQWNQDSIYDVIFCSEMIEHAFEPAKIFDTWKSLLKADGQITLRTCFHSGLSNAEGWWYLEDSTHVGFFSVNSWQWVAEKWNWKIAHMHSPYLVLGSI